MSTMMRPFYQLDLDQANQRYWMGGATVGSQNYCFPFADLDVTGEEIVLRLGDHSSFTFKPGQITKVELNPCQSNAGHPAAAIRIHHNVAEYPDPIAFLFFTYNPEPYFERLKLLITGK